MLLRSTSAIILAFLWIILGSACRADNDRTEEGVNTQISIPPGADAANVDEESIYEVDPEDPYLIFNGTFFDLAPGQAIAPALKLLQKGKLRLGKGKTKVYFIEAPDGAELGFLLPDPSDEARIGSIYVTSDRVVTQQGIRVGISYAELKERLGALELYRSVSDGRIYAKSEDLQYRLDEAQISAQLALDAVAGSTKVVEIVIPGGK